ncbi:transposable element Tcb2 transposase [Trichonephila clavipes]|nr:transposable element Tcb2 transposase [Trichonephila clavipes]
MVCIPLTPHHRAARRRWAAEHRDWKQHDWSQVLFTDESRFSLECDTRRVLVWRNRGTRNNPAFVRERLQYRRAGWMVWGGISIGGRTDLHIIRNGTLTGQSNNLNTSASSLETETRPLTTSNKFAALSTEIQPLVPLPESVPSTSNSEHSNAPEIPKCVKRNSRNRRKIPKHVIPSATLRRFTNSKASRHSCIIMPPKRRAIGRSTPQARKRRALRASESDEQRALRLENLRVQATETRSSKSSDQRD